MSPSSPSSPAPPWTRLPELKAKLLKRWEKGRYLAAPAGSPSPAPPEFPLREPLKGPASAEMADRFGEVQDWIKHLQTIEHPDTKSAPSPQLEWKTVNHRQLGRNALPRAVLFPSPEALAAFLGRSKELTAFQTALTQLTGRLPELADWAARRPFALLDHRKELDRLITAVQWVQANPRPGIYLRQTALPGIDTKFFEQHRKILAQWLDELLPPSQIDQTCSAGRSFARRYGFRSRPELLRFRILDPALLPAAGGWEDLTVPVEEFCRWISPPPPGLTQAFITENDMNGLAFPPVPGSLVLFGRGYNFQSLSAAEGLRRLTLWYWGDIDTHGFAILSQFRTHFPHTRSLLMDRPTLTAHQAHWGLEPQPTAAALPHLTPDESALYQDLQAGRPRPNLRLEQEFIPFPYLQEALRHLPPT